MGSWTFEITQALTLGSVSATLGTVKSTADWGTEYLPAALAVLPRSI